MILKSIELPPCRPRSVDDGSAASAGLSILESDADEDGEARNDILGMGRFRFLKNRHSDSLLGAFQAMEFRPNPLDYGVTGRVVVYFCGVQLQNHTVNTKSTLRDIIIERIRSKFHSLVLLQDNTVLLGYCDTVGEWQKCHNNELSHLTVVNYIYYRPYRLQ